jgi:hypothetical protein
MKNRVPLITAIVLLLLPVAYVASYCLLVEPPGGFEIVHAQGASLPIVVFREPFRWQFEPLSTFYWPLLWIDRQIRPGTWDGSDSFHAPVIEG